MSGSVHDLPEILPKRLLDGESQTANTAEIENVHPEGRTFPILEYTGYATAALGGEEAKQAVGACFRVLLPCSLEMLKRNRETSIRNIYKTNR